MKNRITSKIKAAVAPIAHKIGLRTFRKHGAAIDAAILEAIKARASMVIDYKNEGKRIIEPHAIGFTKAGNVVVRAYQSSGASRTNGGQGNWRLFTVSEIAHARLRWSTFRIREGYKRNDRAMSGGISAEL